ncbi:MAG: helix-turn-helix domain-containing protein [Colwellia sp.]|nr:helix-turn-helix domain-containing protein [Colwellia sp.]
MNLHGNIKDNNKIRVISTSDIDELAQFQVNKNRRYTQLQAGKLQGHYVEVNLGEVQVFREELNAGTLIEAAPANNFVPFGAVLTNDDFNFCGKKREQNTIIQATGGFWDVSFKDSLNYVVAAFNRQSFSRDIELLTGKEIPQEWLVSKTSLTNPLALARYATGVNNIINIVQKRPEILAKENALRMIAESILRLVFNVLKIATPDIEVQAKQSNRCLGVRRVIDYLHVYSDDVPTIADLCKIAKLSERNLQYGFKEYLGVTPIRYLRLVRLNGVRRDLLISHPRKNRIVDIALNWGFIELGRFAGEYRQLFQELPSTTLNNVTMTV